MGHPRWPSAATVLRHFGGWNAALEAAGLPLRRPTTAPASERAERIEVAQRLARAGLRSREIGHLIDVAPRTVRAYLNAGRCGDCGTYVVTDAARCPSCAARHGRPPERSREAVVDAIRAWARSTGGPPTQADWTPSTDPRSKWAREYPRWPSYMTVTTVFGTWRSAVEAAGHRANRRLWTRAEILEALKSWIADHGRPPRQDELTYGAAGMPTMETIRKHFGSYAAALEAAGTRPTRRRWSREQIVDAMRRWRRVNGRVPTSRDWARSGPEYPHATTVRQRFGSWAAASAVAFGGASDRLDSSVSAAPAARSCAPSPARRPTP
jgi:Homing endonuclease associated repeat